MAGFRKRWKVRAVRAGHRRPSRARPPLRSANLGSPIFVESWNGGSPLNWVEFMGRWESTRVDRPANDQES